MSRFFMTFFFFLLFVSVTACSASSNRHPADFSLTFDWNTGSLPPQYHYSYTITIQSDGKGSLDYQPGYEPNEATRWQTEFSLTVKQMDALYGYLIENDLLRATWNLGEPSLGGSGSSLVVTAGGKEYAVPSISELQPEDRKRLEVTIDAIKNLLPQNIWDELDARQEVYESGFEE